MLTSFFQLSDCIVDETIPDNWMGDTCLTCFEHVAFYWTQRPDLDPFGLVIADNMI